MKITRRQLNKIILKEMKRYFPATPEQTSRRDQVMTRKGLGPRDVPGESSSRPYGEYTTLHGLSRLSPDKEPTFPNFIDDLMFGLGFERAAMFQNKAYGKFIHYTYSLEVPGAFPVFATFSATYDETDYESEEAQEMSPGEYRWFFHIVADHVYLKSPDKFGGTMRSVKNPTYAILDFKSKRYNGKIDDDYTTLRRPDKRHNYSSIGQFEYPGLNDPKEFNYLMMNVEEQLAPKLAKIKKDLEYITKAYILQQID